MKRKKNGKNNILFISYDFPPNFAFRKKFETCHAKSMSIHSINVNEAYVVLLGVVHKKR